MFEFVSLKEWLKSGNVYFKTTEENYPNKLPERSTKNSAGYDFFSPFDFDLDADIPVIYSIPHTFIMPTGIKWNPNGLDSENSENVVLMLYPRSSLGFNNKFMFFNTTPIIDADYYNNSNNEGHIIIGFHVFTTNHDFKLKRNDKICQGIITTYFTYKNEKNDIIRTGGIGSTN